jgi:hypothetical protein
VRLFPQCRNGDMVPQLDRGHRSVYDLAFPPEAPSRRLFRFLQPVRGAGPRVIAQRLALPNSRHDARCHHKVIRES